MNIIVVILLVLLLFGGIGVGPWWPHSASWGYAPFGGVGLIVVILLVLLLAGRI